MNGKMTEILDNADVRKRTWQEEAEMLLSLLNCIVLHREAVYASSEFTTGKRFYDLCRRSNVRTAEDLKQRLGKEYLATLLTVNKDEGIVFARKVQKLGHEIVLTPNPFHADPLNLKRNWSQSEYLDFWKMVITQKCQSVYFNEGWQFSNGCTFEYLVGLKAGLPLFDHCGSPLEPAAAREMIADAIESLEKEGFTVPKLRSALTEFVAVSS